jgi:hypothetical protein
MTAPVHQVVVQADTQDNDDWYGLLNGIPGLDQNCCGTGTTGCSCQISQNLTNSESGASVVFTATNENSVDRAQLTVTLWVVPINYELPWKRKPKVISAPKATL